MKSGRNDKKKDTPIPSGCNAIQHPFETLVDVDLACNEPIAEHTSYQVGGIGRYWLEPLTEEAVGQALEQVHRTGLPLLVLGGGSNVLVSDQGFDGVVLHIAQNLAGWQINGTRLTVLAGTRLMDLVRATVSHGLRGIESMAGIPGTVGGALRMNAGAFGQEIETVTESVSGFKRNGRPLQMLREHIQFGYRTAPELTDMVITSATLRMRIGSAKALKARMEEILARRAARQPLEYPSCGSVFKRPPGDYAGRLIDAAGLKGTRVGDAMVSPKHAGFIVNLGTATATDIHQLMCTVQSIVAERFGIQLEPEVKLVGPFNPTG